VLLVVLLLLLLLLLGTNLWQVVSQRLTIVELLLQYRSVPVDLQQLANLLPRMGPRCGVPDEYCLKAGLY
jgi:glutathione S-transferase